MANITINLFKYIPACTISLSATTTSGTTSRTALTGLTDEYGAAADTLLIYNAGSVPAFIAVGSSTIVAATTSLCIAPGAVMAISRNNATHAAAITASSTATVYVSSGIGA